MTDEQTPDPEDSGDPGVIPDERPASLDRLEPLIGSWEMEVSFEAGFFGPDSPAVQGRGGQTTFEWLEGRFFLIQRFTVPDPSAPNGIAIIGQTAGAGSFEQHYYDSRGVSRLYQMELENGVWRVWRDAPGFWQRYRGELAADEGTIGGAWELSTDGSDWKHDFDLNYIRV